MSEIDLPSTRQHARSFPDLLRRQAFERPSLPAVSWPSAGQLETLTWHEYRERVLDIASALVEFGVAIGDTVAILSANRIEHILTDMATVHCGAVPVSVYPTMAREQLAHVIADIGPALIVVDDAAAAVRVARASAVPEHRIFVIDADTDPQSHLPGFRKWHDLEAQGTGTRAANEKELDVRIASIELDQPLTYVYSSGTTGPPKGVILTHRNLLSQIESLTHMEQFNFDRMVSHLPLAHIVERIWTIYMPLRAGGHVLCCPDPAQLISSLRVHRPTFLMTVPRVWEKIGNAAKDLMASSAFEATREALERDRETLSHEWTLQQDGQYVPLELAAAARLAREGAVRDIHTALGLDHVRVPSSGAAPMNSEVGRFLATIGLNISEGYGLTENTGPAIVERPGLLQSGSVGLPMPGWEVRLASDGEILLKGAGTTPGYRNRPEENAALFTDDGWLRTGDIGYLDKAGRLHITDRKKEIIVNAAGKNIAPTGIEHRLAGRSFIDQAMVFGEARPYIVALLTVDEPALRAFAAEHEISGLDIDALIAHPTVLSEAHKLVDDANDALSRPEQIKKFTLVARNWTTESGEMTPTFKLRRRVIQDNHQSLLDALYAQPAPIHAVTQEETPS
ncbi:long-chain fatty acid--CoA ligase [Rhodococcus sp. (in: high G+C Gram-positive bacteria)]|uniref:AMP-dependent synthetase/ligase n=1 Tax=Rhodococcus sp. TaxID=1831 RepID=UPI00257EBBA8|nr:long-chain fatty acid--CoA ligase [Rhodococcus sp. (in: high G+C Gram-positive bacteria)]MBQ9056442.1 long-chain fatty acid--CoA ligase [Rhodococcus sp. (in: high G+C Gram-positive bacteria)]